MLIKEFPRKKVDRSRHCSVLIVEWEPRGLCNRYFDMFLLQMRVASRTIAEMAPSPPIPDFSFVHEPIPDFNIPDDAACATAANVHPLA